MGKKKIITSDFSENEDSESDYSSKKRKRKKGKKLDKFNIYKKSPTKVKRPKKTENGDNRKRLNEEDITAALDESYHEKPKRNRKAVQYDSGDEEEESESEKEDSASESGEDSDEQPEKKRKVQVSITEDNTRRSGRERKVPKKFEVIIPEKKKRKKK